MTKEETTELLKQANAKWRAEKKIILEAYAKSHNPYEIGDVIEDHYHVIQITSISYGHELNQQTPSECIYTGLHLTKAMKPHKIQRDTVMYQCNVKKCHTLKRSK